MYYVSKRLEIAGAHNLKLDYKSKCSKLHGKRSFKNSKEKWL